MIGAHTQLNQSNNLLLGHVTFFLYLDQSEAL